SLRRAMVSSRPSLLTDKFTSSGGVPAAFHRPRRPGGNLTSWRVSRLASAPRPPERAPRIAYRFASLTPMTGGADRRLLKNCTLRGGSGCYNSNWSGRVVCHLLTKEMGDGQFFPRSL